MACNSPLDLSHNIRPEPSLIKVTQGADGSELFAFAMSEAGDMEAVCPDSRLRGALRQVFESGMPVLITFTKGAGSNARLRFEATSVSVRAMVLPFAWNELAERIGSLIDRNATNLGNMARFGDVCVDFSSMQVSRSSGEQISMTAQEFKTLRFFVSNPGRVLSRDELLNRAWGYDNYPCSRTVDNHVLKLRQKLEAEPSRPKHFLTVHSVGYKFLP